MDTIQYTVSARGKYARTPVLTYLRQHFPTIPLEQIESVFGFVDPCTLYGGRPYWVRQLSDADAGELQAHGIGVRIPLTTHTVDRREYEANRWLLAKYHVQGNSLIVNNDTLVPWLREDFPLYRIEASMLKMLNTHERVERALQLYDTVVVPMEMTENTEFLRGVPHKERVTLFANGGCALTCPARICYARISRMNKLLGSTSRLVRAWGYVAGVFILRCSQSRVYRKTRGVVDFDIEALHALGFVRFKLLRARPSGQTGY